MIKKIRNNPWPYAIVAYFALFITGMGSWITFAMRNDMELERTDYYEHEIRFQSQIDRVARTAGFRKQVRLEYVPEQQVLNITLPKAHAMIAGTTSGEIHIYRPEAKTHRWPVHGVGYRPEDR